MMYSEALSLAWIKPKIDNIAKNKCYRQKQLKFPIQIEYSGPKIAHQSNLVPIEN